MTSLKGKSDNIFTTYKHTFTFQVLGNDVMFTDPSRKQTGFEHGERQDYRLRRRETGGKILTQEIVEK